MASKKLTLRIDGPDREPWAGDSIKLRVSRIDSYGEKRLWLNRPGDPRRSVVEFDGYQINLNLDLQFDAGQRYAFWLSTPWYKNAFQLINRGSFLKVDDGEKYEVDDLTIRLMLVPKRAKSSDLDEGFTQLEDRSSPLVAPSAGISRDEFLDLDDAEKMALLNVEAKLRATNVGQASLATKVSGLRLVASDRLFLMMRPGSKVEIETSGDFASAPGHGRPSPSFPDHPDSWKHRIYPVGNLQLSFAEETETWPENGGQPAYSVDADIDLEKGFRHILEWLENNILKPGQKTDQTVVYSLLYGQDIFPDYTLDPV